MPVNLRFKGNKATDEQRKLRPALVMEYFRNRRGMTRAQLAKAANVSEYRLRNFVEAGVIHLEALHDIYAVLGLTPTFGFSLSSETAKPRIRIKAGSAAA